MPEIKRLLVANRGEIAVRVLRAARELNLTAIAIYSNDDDGHANHADEAVEVPEAASFMDVNFLVELCRKRKIDAVHPGYGFLSESAEFARALEKAGVQFIGPSADVLQTTGDKLSARKLAESCDVPVLPALVDPTKNAGEVLAFAEKVGWPVMLKAVDGGGGRGIRLVREEKDLEASFRRAQAESPSGSIFAEKAMVDGCRHIEIQVVGDGETVTHFWERECSIQRRYQKIVEIAPSTLRNGKDDRLVENIIQSALKIAQKIRYRSLGTFEFLASPRTGDFYFMEINPRLQVEHTITEAIANTDLVALQLAIACGKSRGLIENGSPRDPAPPNTSIQLRVTAEDPRRDFALSIGRIKNVVFPGGNGVRVDTHVDQGTIVSPDYDSLLAKVIVTGNSYEQATAKGLRALSDLSIEGVTTNSDLLAGILLSDAFQSSQCDTQWLEKNLQPAVEAGSKFRSSRKKPMSSSKAKSEDAPKAIAGSFSIKKGDRWHVTIGEVGKDSNSAPPSSSAPLIPEQTMQITKISRNDLPHDFAAEISRPDGSSFILHLAQADASEASVGASGGSDASKKAQADPRNPNHLACPLSGQLVEMLVDEGDEVREFDSVAVVRQMKMELDVRAHKKGIVRSLWDVDDGENVLAGMLVCEIVDGGPREKL